MGHILQDWNLDEKRLLLRKARAALPDGGALIVYEPMIDEDRRENAFALLMSLNMLVETPGGFNGTSADHRRWMAGAGFTEVSVQQLAGPITMAIGIK
jgi:O-methyltransferase domain